MMDAYRERVVMEHLSQACCRTEPRLDLRTMFDTLRGLVTRCPSTRTGVGRQHGWPRDR